MRGRRIPEVCMYASLLVQFVAGVYGDTFYVFVGLLATASSAALAILAGRQERSS